jgi:hypothetical protein
MFIPSLAGGLVMFCGSTGVLYWCVVLEGLGLSSYFTMGGLLWSLCRWLCPPPCWYLQQVKSCIIVQYVTLDF